jgi:ferritin-like metal-binding protein YciE
MASITENFTSWLRDAHAMEKHALTMLDGQASRLENYPQLEARLRQHFLETEGQVEVLDGILARYDDSNSVMKDVAGKMSAMGGALTSMMSGDEVIKGALAGYTFEHMEIASYRILIAAAEQLNDIETIRALRGILEQEIAMADWLAANVTDVTQRFLQRDDVGQMAKR